MSARVGLFDVAKPIIAACTLLGLPGRPRHDVSGGTQRIADDLSVQIDALQRAGVDALVLVNENDFPYTRNASFELVAAATAAIERVRPLIRVPFGVDLLWDARATLAVARATDAAFAREIFAGVFDTEMGLVDRDWGELAGYRHVIGADDVAVFTYITAEYGRSISGRSLSERAENAASLGAAAILVSASHSGIAPDLEDLRSAKGGAGNVPVFAATGVTHDNARAVLSVADGAVVGTCLRVEHSIWNPVDVERARHFIDLVREIRASTPASTRD